MGMETETLGSTSRTALEDIVRTAARAGAFRTLVTALQATGMAGALQGKGPFTVFAPTDSAFSNLAAGTLDSLMKPASRDRLAWILSCHIVEGRIEFERLTEISTIKTLHGELVRVFIDGQAVKIDGAQVVRSDVECLNGVIHMVDQVILPGR